MTGSNDYSVVMLKPMLNDATFVQPFVQHFEQHFVQLAANVAQIVEMQ